MRAILITAAAMLSIAALVLPRLGSAQTASVPSTLAGSWTLVGALERSVYTVDAAFAATVATLPELLQGLARDRIRGDMQPPRRVGVTLTGSRVRVTLESDHTATIDGALGALAQTTGLASGTTVTPRVSGGWLELHYQGEGELRQLLSTEADGAHMHLDFTVTSARMPAPVRYRLEYARAP